jgi:Fic family protein
MIMNPLEKVQQLKAELDQFRPLNPEAEARIMQKFRLDWNYHSNNIEGNSLTYGETKAFILFGITAGKKPFKDYLEIKGHNEAINWVLSLVKGETELTEVFIRELHTLLLKESSESFAQTPDGKPTKKKIEVGKYKTLPNHVLTATGEMFYFASPEEAPAKMHELVEWFRAEREKPDVNPIILAALFHYRFIRIHPFDDGNGRTARILMNFILMQFSYPPVIIKTEDKENYYGVLHLADVGELEPFIEYIAENLVHSLEIIIKGAKGEDIEEADDLDKELALLEKSIRGVGKKVEITKNVKALLQVFDKSLAPLANKLIESGRKFNRFYMFNRFVITLDEAQVPGEFDNAIHYAKEKIEQNFSTLKMLYLHEAFNQNSLGSFNHLTGISVVFELTKYIVFSDEDYYNSKNKIIAYEKLYSEHLSDNDIEEIVKLKANQHKEFIEKKYQFYESQKKME